MCLKRSFSVPKMSHCIQILLKILVISKIGICVGHSKENTKETLTNERRRNL